MKKKIYVFGHKNPDTDAIVSATCFAYLKNQLGQHEYIAARAGQLNPQTDYIYKKFDVAPPVLIPDLEPKVEFFMHRGAVTVHENDSLWKAVLIMRDAKYNSLPVVDSENHYKALLSYASFSKNIFESLKPDHHLSLVTTSALLCKTLNGKFYSGDKIDEIHRFRIISGATGFKSFTETLETHMNEKLVVVTGDREDVQLLCAEKKINVLVISGGRVPCEKVVELAKKNGTTIIVSPFDTASTTMLLMYSVPASAAGDHSVKPVKTDDLLPAVRKNIAESPARLLPVVDDENKVIGVISELDIHTEPNIGVALVDHNELTQAVDGIENYTITEIVDHHRIGSAPTKLPITFINLPLGSTSTILAKLFKENQVEIPPKIASLLLCGILSDTLVLQSATTTVVDIETAAELGEIAHLDVKSLGNEIIKAGSRLTGRSAEQIVNQDMKEYKEGKNTFTVSQIEVDGTEEILKRKSELFDELSLARRAHSALFSALLVTDISTLSSIMLVSGEKSFMPVLTFPKQEENIYYLKDVVSRKKQLIPMISELLSSMEEN